jgi:glutaredoxin 3
MEDPKITIFTLPHCPNCERIMKLLDDDMHTYLVRSMEDPEALADLRFGGCFEVEAPIIQIGNNYYTYEKVMAWRDTWTKNRSAH